MEIGNDKDSLSFKGVVVGDNKCNLIVSSKNKYTLLSDEELKKTITFTLSNNRAYFYSGSYNMFDSFEKTYGTDFLGKDDGYTILKRIDDIGISSLRDLIYSLLFSKAFEIVCRSVLSGEYAMDDLFSKRIRGMAKKLREISSKPSDTFYYFSECAVTLSQILDAYNLFCLQTDAQVDKDPSAVLGNIEEYYGQHEYEEYLLKYLADIKENINVGGFLYVNPLLVHFFQAFLYMAKIDQNFVFSKYRLNRLLYLKELLNIPEISDGRTSLPKGSTLSKPKDSNKLRGKGIWQVWDKYQREAKFLDFGYVEEMLKLANLKNDYLINKIIKSCYNEVKNMAYVGQNEEYVFDPRKCRDVERNDETHVKLLLYNHGILCHDENTEIIKLYTAFIEKGSASSEDLDEYEREYIKAIHEGKEKDEVEGLHEYYDKVVISKTGRTSKDIRHYNSKVIEMARDAIYDTAEIRVWIMHHRHDFDEKKGFNQIKKVLLFIQDKYEGDTVCYDNEMLVEYASWCLEFLEIVKSKSPLPNSDRPSRIEEALLLIETLNRLIEKLINSIEGKKYCLPYASKFRGCFFRYQDKQLKRIFVRNADVNNVVTNGFRGKGEKGLDINKFKSSDFGNFVNVEDEKYSIEERRSVVFIASSYVPPLNYEKLKAEYVSLKSKTLKMRNEIHSEYFNRLRDYIKEDSEEQLEDNRRSVVQILGVFAAFLALTTVALSGTIKSESKLPFLTIMIGFTFCISIFVALLYFVTYSRGWFSKLIISLIVLAILGTAIASFYYEGTEIYNMTTKLLRQ